MSAGKLGKATQTQPGGTMKPITEEDRAAMIAAVKVHSDFLVGNDAVEDVAEEWMDHGFGVDTVGPWWRAGCFDARLTGLCDDAGLCPDGLARPSDHPGVSIGYAICNRDMSIEEALRRLS